MKNAFVFFLVAVSLAISLKGLSQDNYADVFVVKETKTIFKSNYYVELGKTDTVEYRMEFYLASVVDTTTRNHHTDLCYRSLDTDFWGAGSILQYEIDEKKQEGFYRIKSSTVELIVSFKTNKDGDIIQITYPKVTLIPEYKKLQTLFFNK